MALFGVRFAAILALAAVLACGDASDPSPSANAAAVAAPMLKPGGFSIAPRDEAIARERFDPATGSLERLGLPLYAQIAKAWGLRVSDLQFQIELPEGSFDVRARPVTAEREAAEALIRGGLSQHFGLVVEQGKWRGQVFELHLAPSGLVPEPTDPRPADSNRDVRRIGEYRVAGAPISDLVEFLGRTSSTPVVDATGLAQHYDLVVEWDTSQGGRALRAALREAGFELRHGRGELQRWVARPAL